MLESLSVGEFENLTFPVPRILGYTTCLKFGLDYRYLHSSIVEGFVEVAFALIRLASHPRLLDTPNDNCQTPLHLAVETKQSNIVRWLIVAGAQPGVRDHMGDMPLHIAARNGDLGCVKAITEPVEKQDRDALQLSYPEKLINQTSNLDQWNSIGK